jgi:hypothetical protein
MKFIANPVEVDAFKITAVADHKYNDGIQLALDDGSIQVATAEMCSRMKPRIGDYWVVQSDGYVYLNPKEVFERKYSPKKEE